jgi:glucose/arabinose dehydrogenase
MKIIAAVAALTLATALSGCGEKAKLPEVAGYGPHPILTDPNPTFLPTINFAKAVGWPKNGKPRAAAGLAVSAFAAGLSHPRWLYVLPNGDVLAAETTAPPQPDDLTGFRGFVAKYVFRLVGAGVASPNRIILLRDSDGDGIADKRFIFIRGLNTPFGMALVGDTLYVADTDAVLAFPYHEGDTRITAAGRKIVDLPAGTINHHWTKNIIASRDGKKLYATVGSNSNVGENGLDKEAERAAILEIDLATGQSRVFASGLRNPNGMAWQPQTGELWTVVNERDELGSDLVPDYLTSVKDGGFYGWPFSYWGQHVDSRVAANPELVKKAIVPDYALGNHTASLGLTFTSGTAMPEQFRNGAFIGQHGSWNRKPFSGYKVIFVPFAEGRPSGQPIDVLTGFLGDKEEARGRPVGVVTDRAGMLLVADDVGNAVWRVAPTAQTATQ